MERYTSNAVAGPSSERRQSSSFTFTMSHSPDVGAGAGGSGGKSSRRGSLVSGPTRTGGSGSKAGAGGLDDPFAGGGGGAGGSGSGSRAFANALLRSPQSPSKKRSYGDRFIPNREGVDLSTSFQLRDEGPPTPTRGSASKRRIVAAVTDLERGASRPSHCRGRDAEPRPQTKRTGLFPRCSAPRRLATTRTTRPLTSLARRPTRAILPGLPEEARRRRHGATAAATCSRTPRRPASG